MAVLTTELLILRKPAFAPGSKWAYCQSGINTAGRIAEVVTGEPLDKLLERRLFGPLGMRDTMFLVQKVSEDWKTLDYGLPGSAEKVTFLSWSSARTARLRSDGAEVTMTFPEPAKFVFRVGRFADITLETRQGEERITYESGEKQGSETLLDSPVTLIAPLTWETRKGTRFQLKKLDHPVINDANRKINSGDWKLTVSGNGDEYNSLKQNLGETARIEYYGEIALEAIGK